MDKDTIREKLSALSQVTGMPAGGVQHKHETAGRQMLEQITELEQQLKGCEAPDLEYLLAIAIRNYTAWYVRGDDRRPLLEATVAHLNKAVELGSMDSQVELTRILIEEKLVRDLDCALSMAAQLHKDERLPQWLVPAIEKAKRWAGKAEFPADTDFSTLTPSPAAIREERTKLRKLLVERTKCGDTLGAAAVAKRLYNLGLLAAYLYDDFDGSSGVSGAAFDAAAHKMRKVNSMFKFDYLGRIVGAEFLSPADYRRIEATLGASDRTLAIEEVKRMVSLDIAP